MAGAAEPFWKWNAKLRGLRDASPQRGAGARPRRGSRAQPHTKAGAVCKWHIKFRSLDAYLIPTFFSTITTYNITMQKLVDPSSMDFVKRRPSGHTANRLRRHWLYVHTHTWKYEIGLQFLGRIAVLRRCGLLLQYRRSIVVCLWMFLLFCLQSSYYH